MTETDHPARQDPLERGAKGVAGRAFAGKQGAAGAGRATVRSALKRVYGKAEKPEQPEAEPTGEAAAAAARKKSQRAAQAGLGMLGQPPDRFDDRALTAWLGKQSAEDLKKLGKLLWAARQDKGEAQSGFGRVERQLAQQGVHLEINAENVTVNLAASPPDHSEPPRNTQPWRPRPTKSSADWGRQWGRVKDFINGH